MLILVSVYILIKQKKTKLLFEQLFGNKTKKYQMSIGVKYIDKSRLSDYFITNSRNQTNTVTYVKILVDAGFKNLNK
jgi:hypothetical protein